MSKVHLDSFKIIGLHKRTSNEPGIGEKDFPAVWGAFMGGNTKAKIPNKVNENIYAVYTEYEGDHTKPYTFMVGCRVHSLDEIPEGMKGIDIQGGSFNKRTVEGNITEGIVISNAWFEIWKENLDRAFKADFEVYDERAMNPKDAKVDIFVSLKENV